MKALQGSKLSFLNDLSNYLKENDFEFIRGKESIAIFFGDTIVPQTISFIIGGVCQIKITNATDRPARKNKEMMKELWYFFKDAYNAFLVYDRSDDVSDYYTIVELS